MDVLFHFYLAAAAGALVTYLRGFRLSAKTIAFLAAASCLIDVDHLLLFVDIRLPVLHNVFFISAVGVGTYYLTRWAKTDSAFAHDVAVVFYAMLWGQLLADTSYGLYGVPLVFPLSTTSFEVPRFFEQNISATIMSPPVTRLSVALTLYLAVIAAIIILDRRLFGHVQAKREEEVPEHQHPR